MGGRAGAQPERGGTSGHAQTYYLAREWCRAEAECKHEQIPEQCLRWYFWSQWIIFFEIFYLYRRHTCSSSPTLLLHSQIVVTPAQCSQPQSSAGWISASQQLSFGRSSYNSNIFKITPQLEECLLCYAFLGYKWLQLFSLSAKSINNVFWVIV